MAKASCTVPAGGDFQLSGGEMSSPSHVYRSSIGCPSTHGVNSSNASASVADAPAVASIGPRRRPSSGTDGSAPVSIDADPSDAATVVDVVVVSGSTGLEVLAVAGVARGEREGRTDGEAEATDRLARG